MPDHDSTQDAAAHHAWGAPPDCVCDDAQWYVHASLLWRCAPCQRAYEAHVDALPPATWPSPTRSAPPALATSRAGLSLTPWHGD